MSASISLCDGSDVRRFVIGKSNGDGSSTVTTEEDDEAVFSDDSLPGKKKFCFYFVKQFAYDDPEIKAKINEADDEIYHCNCERIHITNRLKAKMVERSSLVDPLKNLISSFNEYTAIVPHQWTSVEINDVKKKQEVVTEKIDSLSERLKEINMEIELLNAQMGCVLDQRDRAFERIRFLRMQRDMGNAPFFNSRVVMRKAMALAASGNVRDLEELANSEVDKFMSCWNNDKTFRDDYKKRILPSLDEQKLKHEGDVDTENGNEKAVGKAMELKSFSSEEESDDDSMDFDIPLRKEEEEEIDEEALKEKKREEQLEKARLAMERKRKLREKAAAKAAIRVKKEAEKKLKDLEKRAKKKKKKDAAASNSSSPSDVDRTTKTSVNGRSVDSKQRSFRYRDSRKRNEDVPKAIMKRRKAYRLWIWTVSSAALAVLLGLLVVFFYMRSSVFWRVEVMNKRRFQSSNDICIHGEVFEIPKLIGSLYKRSLHMDRVKMIDHINFRRLETPLHGSKCVKPS